jgi:DNA-binding IclR family transcriptional regulator
LGLAQRLKRTPRVALGFHILPRWGRTGPYLKGIGIKLKPSGFPIKKLKGKFVPVRQKKKKSVTAEADAKLSEAPDNSAPALDKGLDILELLCSVETPLTQKEIASRLERSVGEIYRMLACLVARKYVVLADDSYHLTTKIFELAHRNPPTQRLLLEARPIMQSLSSALDQACHLTVYGQGRQVVIAKVDVPNGMGFSVLLAFQDTATQALRIAEALERAPGHANPLLQNLLNKIRKQGFESAASVQVRGLYAVSFPILDNQGHAMAALTVPYAERIDLAGRKTIAEVEAALKDAARRLSALMAG